MVNVALDKTNLYRPASVDVRRHMVVASAGIFTSTASFGTMAIAVSFGSMASISRGFPLSDLDLSKSVLWRYDVDREASLVRAMDMIFAQILPFYAIEAFYR